MPRTTNNSRRAANEAAAAGTSTSPVLIEDARDPHDEEEVFPVVQAAKFDDGIRRAQVITNIVLGPTYGGQFYYLDNDDMDLFLFSNSSIRTLAEVQARDCSEESIRSEVNMMIGQTEKAFLFSHAYTYIKGQFLDFTSWTSFSDEELAAFRNRLFDNAQKKISEARYIDAICSMETIKLRLAGRFINQCLRTNDTYWPEALGISKKAWNSIRYLIHCCSINNEQEYDLNISPYIDGLIPFHKNTVDFSKKDNSNPHVKFAAFVTTLKLPSTVPEANRAQFGRCLFLETTILRHLIEDAKKIKDYRDTMDKVSEQAHLAENYAIKALAACEIYLSLRGLDIFGEVVDLDMADKSSEAEEEEEGNSPPTPTTSAIDLLPAGVYESLVRKYEAEKEHENTGDADDVDEDNPQTPVYIEVEDV
jgi:hypothetical protein